ncbi:MAG TPA: zinc finger protein [Gemmatimonadaceae bacterium]|nr:zinc finger protein [Gemmatimonadaceae bacterium]
MTDSDRSLSEVPALLEEKRRYEAWLAALDARRDTTPPHVFERVQSDYTGRLRQVEERLASHAQAIDSERASLESRLSLLAAEEQLRRDERTELELRAHVGELSGDEATSAFRAVDDALEQLVKERTELQRKVDELSALLVHRPPAEEAPAGEEPVEPAAASARATPSFDELAFLNTVVGESDSPAPAPSGDPSDTSGTESPAEAELPSEPPVSQLDVPAQEEIAPSVVRDVSDAESLLAGIGDSRQSGGDLPLAANVPANTPIKLRTSGAIEQSKTLKCSECGAMNYPTEWYCERCGAELAAL